ncbi:MAG: sphinganine kinase lcb4 [Sclerophora amabilis]|nr:MAG: sphinganine kinase lcb4 [Sclerophora amabilis]
MDSISNPNRDPFADQYSNNSGDSLASEATLTVGRNASLTLATDSLIVLGPYSGPIQAQGRRANVFYLDEGLSKRDRRKCCGLLANKTKATRVIPLFNVLWADLSDLDVTICYAQSFSNQIVRPAFINYPLEKTDGTKAKAWIKRLVDRAYNNSQRCKRVKLLINSFSGVGSAQKIYLRDIEPILAAGRCQIDVERTLYQGHAVDIAERLNIDAYDVVACCSGDGVPHEVFNGLGKRRDARRALAKVAVVQLPCGSGNAMSWNLFGTGSPSLAALSIVKGLATPMDLISITQGDRRTLSFLSQSVGIVAEMDLATENLRWMGSARFTYGFLVRVLGKTIYPCDIAVKVEMDDKNAIKEHYQRELDNHAGAAERRGCAAARNTPSGESSSAESDDIGLPPLQYGSATDDLPADWSLVPYDNLGNFYAGNMAYMAADTNFFPAALPNDGCLDLICIPGDISRLAAIQCLTAVQSRTLFDKAHVSYRKLAGYRIIPKAPKPGYISIDGERVPFEPFQAEVHKGLGTVLSKTGHVYEALGPA